MTLERVFHLSSWFEGLDLDAFVSEDADSRRWPDSLIFILRLPAHAQSKNL